MIAEKTLALLKRHEGLRLAAYLCPGGVWTIGYGHTGADVRAGLTITEAKADELLRGDAVRFSAGVRALCPSATGSQHAAMTCLAYNIGLKAFAASSVARLHNAGRHGEAAQAFALWNKVKGRVRPGLVRRRADEAALYLEDAAADSADAADIQGATPLGRSKQMIGAAVGGGATLAAQAPGVLSDLAWVKQNLADLVPYLPMLSHVLAVVGLVGIALTLYGRWKQHSEGRA